MYEKNSKHREWFYRRRTIKQVIFIASVLALLTVSISVYSYNEHKKMVDFRTTVENSYNRSFHELVDNLRNVQVELNKAMLVESPEYMGLVASEIDRAANDAKSNLSQLPVSNINLENTSRFLSQVGAYTTVLYTKMLEKQPISPQEYDQLNSLSKYAQTLNDLLAKMQDEIYQGKISFSNLISEGNKTFSQTQEKSEGIGLDKIEEGFNNYPSLVYDGPFSEHIEKMTPEMLKGGKEISKEEAQNIAVNFVGKDKAKKIEQGNDQQGKIATYSFNIYPDENNKDRVINIDITKINGYVLWSLDNRNIPSGADKLDFTAATQKAKDFLTTMGYKNMVQSYYDKSNGIATINFAYMQDNVTMYSDLVKVKVALDTGEVLGFESKGYIMSHKDVRALETAAVSSEVARKAINAKFDVSYTKLALIPKNGVAEILCYEFKGSFNGQNYIIYVNAKTGKDENVLLLLESPDGVLTI